MIKVLLTSPTFFGEQLRPELEDIIELGIKDTDQWLVRLVARVCKSGTVTSG